MSDASGSVRCDGCGLINWASAGSCKRCGAALGARGEWSPGDSWRSPSYGGQSARHTGGRSSGSFGKLIVGVIVVMALAGTLYGGLPEYLGGPKWRDFTFAPGNFSVRMPAQPEVDTSSLAPPGELSWMRTSAKLWRKEGCFANVTDIPFLQVVGDAELEKVALQMAKSTESTVLSKRAIALDGGRGIELEMKPPDKLMTDGRAYCRIYLLGSRIYMLMLVGHENGRLVRERGQFFDSFKLLQKGFTPPHSY